jgi:hypothetical protein
VPAVNRELFNDQHGARGVLRRSPTNRAVVLV